MRTVPPQLPAKQMLARAGRRGYAVGAFNCRYPQMMRAVFEAACEERSPVIIQIAQLELEWFTLTLEAFMEEVRRWLVDLKVDVPYAVHLDHSWDTEVIEQAIINGFTSVMVDASAQPLERNIARTREIVEMAHADGVGVEAELGRSISAVRLPGAQAVSLRTNPFEAGGFIRETKCDFLAVEVGESGGGVASRMDRLDAALVEEIGRCVGTPLVLHGSERFADAEIARNVQTPGGIAKVNIGNAMEMAMLEVLGLPRRLPADEMRRLLRAEEEIVLPVLKAVAVMKMRSCLHSSGQAWL